MIKKEKIRIGCASGFWGDTSTAAKQLVEKGNLDYLVFDFLAEMTMSILAGAKNKDSDLGYATDFIEQISPLLKHIKDKNIKVLTNAGGLNPDSCKSILETEAEKVGTKLNIAILRGDNLQSKLPVFLEDGIKEMESNDAIPDSCISINAYLGSPGMVKALEQGADIVITGRCVDSALVLAPLMYEFGWCESDYDLLSSGSLAGHIIECGAQCTGGNFTDWEEVRGFDDMGFPYVDVFPNGDFIVSKPENTGGMVTVGTVTEQLLYEIGNPAEYILPDVVCDFTKVTVENSGSDEVIVKGARGFPPTRHYKISATYINGYRVAGTLVIGGKNSKRKGEIIAEAILKKCSNLFKQNGLDPFTKTSYECIGTDSIYGPEGSNIHSREIVLRIMAMHKEKDALTILSKEIAQAATGMAAGVINYLGGRPRVSRSIHLFSFLLAKNQINIELDIDNNIIPVNIDTKGGYAPCTQNPPSPEDYKDIQGECHTPLSKIAFARSGDKGDHANIGVIARKAHYYPYIDKALTKDIICKIFSHVLDGSVTKWRVPGINGINFLLKNSLGGGGMASLNIDPQGKSYAQQLLEYSVPISRKIYEEVNS